MPARTTAEARACPRTRENGEPEPFSASASPDLARNLLSAVSMFAHVLVPIDLSKRSTRILRIVETLPTKRVTLLHVIHQVPGVPSAELRPFYNRLRRQAGRVVEQAAATLSASGLRVQHAVTIGDPAREILRVAAGRRADLVVLGSHQLGPRPGQGLGTTSYKVALACKCPVLLVK
jgi:nucleotide-binding universal stress UspA family protein